MHIAGIDIENIPPLTHVAFDFNERVNVFIGPNASGKSTILRIINYLYSIGDFADARLVIKEPAGIYDPYLYGPDVSRASLSVEPESIDDDDCLLHMRPSDDWPRPISDADDQSWRVLPLLYIPATRVSVPSLSVSRPRTRTSTGRSNTPPFRSLWDEFQSVFLGHNIRQLIDWFREDESVSGPQLFDPLIYALGKGFLCAKEICTEVITHDVPQPYVDFDRFDGPFAATVHNAMGIHTSDRSSGGPLYAGDLSSGTQGTLVWVWALSLVMASHYEWIEGWDEAPAFLLIDEIENHLHPTWQRRVIPSLLKHFPGLQVFATTHSPFVVAGLKSGQVHLLSRGSDGSITATTNTEDVVGWTMDEILREMMEVADPTDDATAAAARELRLLRHQGPRGSEDEEAERQRRIKDLLKLVDRDLLAGGPMAAQLQLFEEQFDEALRRYRESNGITEDDG